VRLATSAPTVAASSGPTRSVRATKRSGCPPAVVWFASATVAAVRDWASNAAGGG
jgi:hypothetical protein